MFKVMMHKHIDVIEAVMPFVIKIIKTCDAESSPGKDNTEYGRTSDSESPEQVVRKKGRPKKYLTELDAVEARRRRARDYYHRNSEKIKDQQKLYQHWRRDQLKLERRARYKEPED